MRVASFNVNSVRARLPIVLEWLRENSPDALCLQETKVPDSKFPWKELEAAGYKAAYKGEKGYNGVAIIGREKPRAVKIGFDEEETGGTRLICAEVGGIPIVNTYVPQGYEPGSERFLEKLEWLRRLREYFDENFNPAKPLAWLGDFNIAPEAVDVYDPELLEGQVGFNPDEREVLQMVKGWGFVDVFRRHHPEPEQYTFFDYQVRNAVKNKVGWRIDHIWATKPLAEKSKDCWIDLEPRLKEKPSDHTPVVAEFSL
jgi:exodeoxyribonuclease-3